MQRINYISLVLYRLLILTVFFLPAHLSASELSGFCLDGQADEILDFGTKAVNEIDRKINTELIFPEDEQYWPLRERQFDIQGRQSKLLEECYRSISELASELLIAIREYQDEVDRLQDISIQIDQYIDYTLKLFDMAIRLATSIR